MRTIIFISLFIIIPFVSISQADVKVKQGDKAINFELNSLNGDKVKLSELNKNSQLVLIVLRGWPEYQCPVCSRQVGQFIAEAEAFEQKNTKVLFVYPGPSDVLQEKAKEFTEDFTFPDNFYFTIDPDYSMINKYGLRWDAPKETAYPATFVINKKGKITYSLISSSHRGRTNVADILTEVDKL